MCVLVSVLGTGVGIYQVFFEGKSNGDGGGGSNGDGGGGVAPTLTTSAFGFPPVVASE